VLLSKIKRKPRRSGRITSGKKISSGKLTRDEELV